MERHCLNLEDRHSTVDVIQRCLSYIHGNAMEQLSEQGRNECCGGVPRRSQTLAPATRVWQNDHDSSVNLINVTFKT